MWGNDSEKAPANSIEEFTPAVSIAWTNGSTEDDGPEGSSMRLVIQISSDEILREADQIRRYRAETRPAEIKPEDLPEGVLAAIVSYPPEVVTFNTTGLTRQEAQKMIRVARKARDQVHGADE